MHWRPIGRAASGTRGRARARARGRASALRGGVGWGCWLVGGTVRRRRAALPPPLPSPPPPPPGRWEREGRRRGGAGQGLARVAGEHGAKRAGRSARARRPKRKKKNAKRHARARTSASSWGPEPRAWDGRVADWERGVHSGAFAARSVASRRARARAQRRAFPRPMPRARARAAGPLPETVHQKKFQAWPAAIGEVEAATRGGAAGAARIQGRQPPHRSP